jgi:hypothetical protein
VIATNVKLIAAKIMRQPFKEENDTHLMHMSFPPVHPKNTAPSVVNSMRHKYIEIVTVVNMFNAHETQINRDRKVVNTFNAHLSK